jgi:hypothetical protein
MKIEINKENFDWEFYTNYHSDLKENGILLEENAWNHWTNKGIYENREIKIKKNLDNIINNVVIHSSIISDSIISSFTENEINDGIKENNLLELSKSIINNIDVIYENFNWKFYLNYYKDLAENGIITKNDAWIHWKSHGTIENRIMQILYIDNYSTINEENFDWIFYLDFHDDLLYKGIKTKEHAYEHWLNIGMNENREIQKLYAININDININNFDLKFYFNSHNDLNENGIITKEDLWDHWLNFGKIENRIFAIKIENNKIFNSFIYIDQIETEYKNIYKKYNKNFGKDQYDKSLKILKNNQSKILNNTIFDKISKIKMKNNQKKLNKSTIETIYYLRLFYLPIL